MVSMFFEVNNLHRKKFIALYEEFLENPFCEEIKKKAEGMGIFGGGDEFTNAINLAAIGAYKIELGTLSTEEAKKILEELKKEENIENSMD